MTPNQAKVQRAIIHGHRSLKAIAYHSAISLQSALKAVSALRKQGQVRRIGKQGKAFLWEVNR